MKSKKKPLPVPIENWFRHHQDDVTALNEMLNSQTMQRAIATLHEAALPNASTTSQENDLNNNRFVWLAGYCDFARDLQKLTTPPNTNNTKNQPEEWTHL